MVKHSYVSTCHSFKITMACAGLQASIMEKGYIRIRAPTTLLETYVARTLNAVRRERAIREDTKWTLPFGLDIRKHDVLKIHYSRCRVTRA